MSSDCLETGGVNELFVVVTVDKFFTTWLPGPLSKVMITFSSLLDVDTTTSSTINSLSAMDCWYGFWLINQLMIRPSCYQPTVDREQSVYDSWQDLEIVKCSQGWTRSSVLSRTKTSHFPGVMVSPLPLYHSISPIPNTLCHPIPNTLHRNQHTVSWSVVPSELLFKWIYWERKSWLAPNEVWVTVTVLIVFCVRACLSVTCVLSTCVCVCVCV